MDQMTSKKLMKVALILIFFCQAYSVGLVSAAQIIVDTAKDELISSNDGKCSLREAIEAANNDVAVDSCRAGNGFSFDDIEFFIATPAVIKLKGQLIIEEGINIIGLGPNNLTIDADFAGRHFEIKEDVINSDVYTVMISQMRLINGLTSSVDTNANGGSIHIQKNTIVFIDNAIFENNVSVGSGGAIFADNSPSINDSIELNIHRTIFNNNESQASISGGGAIRLGIGNSLTATESTFTLNRANNGIAPGGAIDAFSDSDVFIERSTFNKNLAYGDGGAIRISNSGLLNIIDSTIVENIANADAFGITDHGGGISAGSNANLIFKNSVIASNVDKSQSSVSSDIFISTNTTSILSAGYNLIGTNNWGAVTGVSGAPNADLDIIGTDTSPFETGLLPLADNGGGIPTMAIPDPSDSLSPLLDSGECSAATDQRTVILMALITMSMTAHCIITQVKIAFANLNQNRQSKSCVGRLKLRLISLSLFVFRV